MRVLFTAGGTEEAIDGVRRISNSSTGRTGAILAAYFAGRGDDVTLLRSERALSPRAATDELNIKELTYLDYADLRLSLRNQLSSGDWDAVVHLAAVSDYRVAEVSVDGVPFPPGGPGKIGTGREVILKLVSTAKILDSLREWSRNKSIIVVGFKLTDGADDAEAQVNAQFARGGVDYVVHNDLAGISAETHFAAIWGMDGLVVKTETKNEMAEGLYSILAGEKI
jgi:phosphopantothenoylcysteine synthetase/decarboxylase